MKKNKMMRLASVLLVAVLLTTSVISGTFAKYVTSDSSSDSARVAKWGVSVVASGDDLFHNEYKNTASEVTVKSKTPENEIVVAPGTSNAEFGAEGLKFVIKGAPEVAVKITYNFAVTEDIFLKKGEYFDGTTGAVGDKYEFDVADTDYYPVVFTLKKDGAQVAQGNLTAIKTYFDGITLSSTNIAANTTLDATYLLTWEWTFGDPANNKKDTTLGNLAAGTAEDKSTLTDGTDYNLDLGYSLGITIEQVD